MVSLLQKRNSSLWTIFLSNRNKTLIGNRYFLEPLNFYKKRCFKKVAYSFSKEAYSFSKETYSFSKDAYSFSKEAYSFNKERRYKRY